ncbi:hypothetical protein L842_6268 [Mycobacterium intracellulare MIN_052511_1280]|nr:hypothetical protein L842_6268 [Mycobacterium intracellulare MIN_052511_1280]
MAYLLGVFCFGPLDGEFDALQPILVDAGLFDSRVIFSASSCMRAAASQLSGLHRLWRRSPS